MKESSIKMTEKYKKRDSTEHIVVHHAATGPDHNATLEDIHRWHLARGWSGVGYHFVIERSGALRVGRPLWAMGAHVYGFNDVSLGICVVGGVDDKGAVVDNFTSTQYETLEALLITLSQHYPNANICKHKDLASTECSDINLKKIIS